MYTVTVLNGTEDLKTVKMVNFVLCIFSHNKKIHSFTKHQSYARQCEGYKDDSNCGTHLKVLSASKGAELCK
jgi:hypothetical protein